MLKIPERNIAPMRSGNQQLSFRADSNGVAQPLRRIFSIHHANDVTTVKVYINKSVARGAPRMFAVPHQYDNIIAALSTLAATCEWPTLIAINHRARRCLPHAETIERRRRYNSAPIGRHSKAFEINRAM